MRHVVFFLILVLMLNPVVAECVEGIDDICDLKCIEVDYDCIENNFSGIQDVGCIVELNGVCTSGCEDVDWDCYLEDVEENKVEDLSDEAIDEILAEVDSSALTTEPDALDRTQYVFIALGSLFLMAVTYLLLARFWFLHNLVRFKDLIPYGQQALEKGYSIDVIKQSLENKGYSKQDIKYYVKALEHKP